MKLSGYRAATVLIGAVSAVNVVGPALGQEQSFSPAGASWAANDVIYWGAPALAALLSLIIGITWHQALVRKQYEGWSGTAPPGTFASLCGGPLLVTFALFLAVGGLFLYIRFGSARTLDEWISHQRIAWWSLGLSTVVAVVPWFTVTKPWVRS